ncbi:hypothetical protein [Bacillus sp. NPDC094077]|uniref:hypothetical protein n=1 Tax=Bacillus sp. NPDC094077 TaxID=3390932 RepID=UPI003D06C1CD
MKKLDLVINILDLNKRANGGLEPLYDAGLTEIYEVFYMLDFKESANVLLCNIFGDVFSENIEDYCDGRESRENFSERLLTCKADLIDPVIKSEIFEIIKILVDIEKERYITYNKFADMGVTFDIPEVMGCIQDFIYKLVNSNVADAIYGYCDEEITKEELLDFIMSKLENTQAL